MEHYRSQESRGNLVTYGLILLLLIAMTVAVYYPSLHYPFEFDDIANIVKHFNIRTGSLKTLFCTGSRWICYWLNSFYYTLNPLAQKFNPYVYRCGNLAIHLLSGIMVYCLTLLMQRARPDSMLLQRGGLLMPFCVAGLFLLHPVQTQTVSYVVQGQLEGLAMLCMLTVSVLFLARSLTQSRGLRWLLLGGAYLIAFFATGSKEIVIVLPLILMLIDWFFVARGSYKAFRANWWLHALFVGIIGGMYLYFLKPIYFVKIFGGKLAFHSNIGNSLTVQGGQKITAWSFFISQFKVILHYIGIFMFPVGLSVDYDWTLSQHIFSPDSLGPLVLLLLLFGYLIARWRRDSGDLVTFCGFWFFIMVLPRSSIIPSTELLADYKTYPASYGMMLLLGSLLAGAIVWASEQSWWRGGRSMVWTITLLVLSVVGYGAYQRNLVWSSSEAFWGDIIAHAPGRARAHNNYGIALCDNGQHRKSLKSFRRAILLDSNYADPYTNLAFAYGALHEYDRAIEALQHAIRIMPTQPEGYNNLAAMLMNKDDDAEAGAFLWQAIGLRPHYGKAYFNLGKWHLKHNRDEEAWEAFKACCTRADFDNQQGFIFYGNLSMALKKYDDAIYAYSKAIVINPRLREIALKRAQCAFEMKDYERAHRWYAQTRQHFPDWYMPIAQHAELFRLEGDYETALRLFDEARIRSPNVAILYSKIIACAEKLGRYAYAREVAEVCLAQHPPAELEKEMQRVCREYPQRSRKKAEAHV